mgnify:CR=1 FL=1
MKFSKKNMSEKLSGITLYGVEVKANGNNVGNCPTNNNASGCGCSK